MYETFIKSNESVGIQQMGNCINLNVGNAGRTVLEAPLNKLQVLGLQVFWSIYYYMMHGYSI
jgi:hypothetical protein